MSLVRINTYKDSGKWYDEIIYDTPLNPIHNEDEFFRKVAERAPQTIDMNHTIHCEYKTTKGDTCLYHYLKIRKNEF